MKPTKRRRNFRVVLFSILLILAVVLFFLGRDIYTFSLAMSERPSDAAIVLGAKVWGDQPSPVFEERIAHAIELYKNGIIENIIFTGGTSEGQTYSESEIGKMYALNHDVAEDHIFVETESNTTCRNLLGAKDIIDREGFEQVLIVSDPLHMRRAIWLAENIGLEAESSPTQTSRYQSWGKKAGFLFREIYFYGGYLLNIYTCEKN